MKDSTPKENVSISKSSASNANDASDASNNDANDANDTGDDLHNNNEETMYCTRAITGSEHPAHQPIYICESCRLGRPADGDGDGSDESDENEGEGKKEGNDTVAAGAAGTSDVCDDNNDDEEEAGEEAGEEEESEAPLPSCICQSCAEVCHANHQVYFVGMGPCTCDCCDLIPASNLDDDEDGENGSSEGGEGGESGRSDANVKNDENSDENEAMIHCGGCQLAMASQKEAQKLGFGEGSSSMRLLNDPIPLKIPPVATLLPVMSMMNADGEEEEEEEKERDRAIDDEKDHDNHMDNNQHEEQSNPRALDEWMSNICIECHSSLGGYTYGSFTMPCLNQKSGGSDNNDLCEKLIQQAEVLTQCSRDTFWIPIDDNGDIGEINDDGDGNGADGADGCCTQWCDLEILAREIYRQHSKAYSLHDPSHGGGQGGAEWWVQYKPAGSDRAPVDLHYDKDEELAEKFGLGSFPTLSTVTYLTGKNDIADCDGDTGNINEDKTEKEFDNNDNAPTVIFPHTYNDEEDRPIPMMLLSHAVRGKHVVFDGRLLHGAPAHPALRHHRPISQDKMQNSEGKGEDELSEIDCGSSLRVTFLVNIWRTGKPAGVHILPESIRCKLRAAADDEAGADSVSLDQTGTTLLQNSLPLEFQPRNVSWYSVPETVGSATKSDRIILPFVSQGATWIGGEEVGEKGDATINEMAVSEKKLDESKDKSLSGNEESNDEQMEKGDKEEENEDGEEEDEDLFLVLPQFASSEYLKDVADTAIFSFDSGNEAKLMRQGALDEGLDGKECQWRNFIAKKAVD